MASIFSGLQEENISQDVRISELETLVNNGSSVGGNVTGITYMYFMERSKQFIFVTDILHS